MDTIGRLADISDRFEHLELCSEWIVRQMANIDPVVSQTAALILTIAEDLRERTFTLIRDIERGAEIDKLN